MVGELFEQAVGLVEPAPGSSEVSDQRGDARGTHECVRTVRSSAAGQGEAREGSGVPVTRADTDEAPDGDRCGERT